MTQKKSKEYHYHILFWSAYLMLWAARELLYHQNYFHNIINYIVLTVPIIPFVYANLYILIPRYLLQKKIATYLLLFTVGVGVSTLLRFYTSVYYYFTVLELKEVAFIFDGPNGWVIAISETVVVTLISMAIFMVKNWYLKDQYTKELENKHMMAELNLLKSQIQPHFLFNNLNTIYFLMGKQPEKAKEVVMQLSDALSHQLYKANQDEVLLADELEYIENYIKMEELRHQDFMTLHYKIPVVGEHLKIAPMILITFIENAFKHSVHSNGYTIDIVIREAHHVVYLEVKNTIGERKHSEVGGVGLDNVKKRLELLYPNQYQLDIKTTTDGLFVVNLEINLP